MPEPAPPATKNRPTTMDDVASFHTNNHADDTDGSDFYEDLPPKQIWMTTMNSSPTGSGLSPITKNDDTHYRTTSAPTARTTTTTASKITAKKLFSSKNLILDGHVWMGGMMQQSSIGSTTTGATLPALCTPDSTQTDHEDPDEEPEEEPLTLGIGAAPFYGGITATNSSSHEEEESSTPTHSDISSNEEDGPLELSQSHDAEYDDDDDDLSSSIPSFSTRRIILDLQDDLARTKAELAQYKNLQDSNNNNAVVEQPITTPLVTKQEQTFKEVSPEGQEETEQKDDANSVNAVVLAVPKKQPTTTTTTSNGVVVVLQARLDRSEQRVGRLSAKLKESNLMARRLYGTLQRVKDRMQKETLPYEYHLEDVRFMSACGQLLVLAICMVAPLCLVYLTDLAAFGLVICVTFVAVEIAVRP